MNLIRGQNWKTFLLSTEGRTPRCDYWLGLTVPYVGLTIVAGILDAILIQMIGFGFVTALFALAFVYPSIVVAIKRCHDRGRSGWFLLLFLLPFVNFWAMIEIAFLRGTVGPNNYGPDPIT